MTTGFPAEPRQARQRRLLCAGLLFLTLGVLGCSSAGDPSAGDELPSASPSATTSASPTTAPATAVLAPLTGLPVTAEVAARPAVVVPISVDASRPPTGLGSADVVYAEWDGKAGIRLLALFQSQDNPAVGPVGGLGATDAKLLPVVKPVLAAGASYLKFTRQSAAAGLNVATVSAHPTAYRQSGGSAYAATVALRALAAAGTTAPPSLIPRAEPGDPLATMSIKTVNRFNVPDATHPVFSWTWDSAAKRWRSTVGGAAISAANVIVLVMGYKTILAKAPQGPAIFTADVFGSGPAYAVSGGKGATGVWARNGPLQVHTFATSDGTSMRFMPGPTWIIFVPTGNAWATG